MKKIIPLIAASSLVAATAFAGGPEALPPAPPCQAPISAYIEALFGVGWTNDIRRSDFDEFDGLVIGDQDNFDTVSVFNRGRNNNNAQFAGRVALGMEVPLYAWQGLSWTASVGMGWLGNRNFRTFVDVDNTDIDDGTTTVSDLVNVEIRDRYRSWYGDALFGVLYHFAENFTVNLEGGPAVITTNHRFSIDVDNVSVPGTEHFIADLPNSFVSVERNTTSVEPEIKVGLGWQFTPNFRLVASYQHLFRVGSSSSSRFISFDGTSLDDIPPDFDDNISVKVKDTNTGADIVSGGLVWSFGAV